MITIGTFIDLTGKRFGRLTVQKRVENRGTSPQWLCNCDCGNTKVVLGSLLRNGHTKSCGCLHNERIVKYNKIEKKKYNTYDLSQLYGIGWTTNTNQKFYFDLEDYEKIENYTWLEDKAGYIYSTNGIFLHRLILGLIDKDWKSIQVDHIYHKKFDNRKENLRIVDCSKNSQNRSLMSNNKTGVTGVCWDKKSKKWKVAIMLNYQKNILGFYSDFDEAVKVRKEAEEKYFGKYSYDNSMSIQEVD